MTAVLFFCGVLAGGCVGLSETGSLISPPPSPLAGYFGLVFAEDLRLRAPDGSTIGLTPRPGTVSVYRGELLPGGTPVEFRSHGPGGVFLAWVPLTSGWKNDERVSVRLTSHEITLGTDSVRTQWPESAAPVAAAAVRTGGTYYLGRLVRTVDLSLPMPSFGPGGVIVMNRSPGPAVSLAFSPDPDEKALLAACLDHPWLPKLLPHPPGRLK